MNATERNVENIVAIDLGKFNSAVCIFKKSTFKSNFRTIKTNGQDFHDLFVELEPDVVLIEAGSSRKVQKIIAPAIFTFQGCKKLSSSPITL